jgi:hypothetical protein
MALPTPSSVARSASVAAHPRLPRYVAAPRLHRAEIAALRERVVRPRRDRPVVTSLSRKALRESARTRPRRPSPPQVVAATGVSSSAVYLLLHARGERFKLGWSAQLGQRIARLPEYREAALDLRRSLVVWLPNRQRAEEVERSMHKLLRPFSVDAGHRADGHTEWFTANVWQRAVELLSRIPLRDDPARLACVHTLAGALHDLPLPATAHTSVHDIWLRIEDLLRRIAHHVPMRLDPAQGPTAGPLLRLVGIRLQWNGELSDLRTVVLDSETWQHRSPGAVHAFVQWLMYEGDDLLLQFVPLQRMDHWDPELHLPTQVLALLHRLVVQRPAPTGGQTRLDA